MRKTIHRGGKVAEQTLQYSIYSFPQTLGSAVQPGYPNSFKVLNIMYELKVITDFSAAHQLKDFEGACEDLHGHNWKIEVYVTSEVLNDAGIVVDFRILKKHVNTVMAGLDHKFLNDLEAFKDDNPSSENIARYVADQLSTLLQGSEINVSRVTAWESETSCATYYPS
jgi:6-pyruvoyltetrahydropterin/6-carboxytetrahydropterin synthase